MELFPQGSGPEWGFCCESLWNEVSSVLLSLTCVCCPRAGVFGWEQGQKTQVLLEVHLYFLISALKVCGRPASGGMKFPEGEVRRAACRAPATVTWGSLGSWCCLL